MVCEGRRTEPEYIHGFVRSDRSAAVQVHIPAERGDPRRIVDIATALANAARAEARRHGDPLLAYDKVWCVFDRDQHERFAEAIQLATDRGLRLAVSNPCVELWLLLHFRDSPGARHRHDLSRLLKDHLPTYEKGVDYGDFAATVEQAARRAQRLDDDATQAGERGRNPTTGFYRLVRSMQGAPLP